MNAATVNPAALVPAPSAAPALTKRKSKKTKWLLIGGALLFIAAGGTAAYMKNRGAAGVIPITTEKASIKTITQVVTATGKVQPEVEVKISPEVYGEITLLPFREGAIVKKGELVVKIKPDLYQAQVEQQTAAVASAAAVAKDSEAKVVKAEADLKKYQDLYKRNLVSDSDYTLYKANFDVAKADLDAALANVDSATGLLNQARDALSKTVLYAPMDGTVSSRSSEVGERVVATGSFAGTEIMRVADLNNMEVRVKVNENDIVNVKVGDTAKIAIDAYPDRKIVGVVREIGASADNNGAAGSGSSAQSSASVSDEVTNFIVKIRVTDRSVVLRPGMSATADIETQTVKGAVAIPIQSVTVRDATGLTTDQIEEKNAKEMREKTGNDMDLKSEKEDALREREKLQVVVFVKTGDVVKMRKVQTGIADNSVIEVKSGIKPGDEVVSGSYTAISRKLKDGAKVRIEKPKPAADEAK
jgi:HlyD family secretion protein